MHENRCDIEAKWINDVNLMARRTALFYHYVAEVLIEKFGEEKASELLHESIKRLGHHIGENIREKVKGMGHPIDLDGFETVKDLPSKGWKTKSIQASKEISEFKIEFCPLAKVWLDMKTPLARIYCYVDQGKYEGYNPDFICRHTKNLLDGDECCILKISKEQ